MDVQFTGPNSEGLDPKSDGLQPTSDGLQTSWATVMVYRVMLMPNCSMEEISRLSDEKSKDAETIPPKDSRTPMIRPAMTFTPKAPQSGVP